MIDFDFNFLPGVLNLSGFYFELFDLREILLYSMRWPITFALKFI